LTHIPVQPAELASRRARYEEHQRKGLEFAPKAFPSSSNLPAEPIDLTHIIHREIIPGGWYWSTKVLKGEVLRVEQGEGNSTVALVAWNANDTTERMNLVDTAKVQWSTVLSKGRVIFSDMGRIMFSLIEDSMGAHDSLMGGSNAASNAAKYPGQITRNTRDNLVLIAGKLGLERRDIAAVLNLFAPTGLSETGAFQWRSRFSNNAQYCDLRAEMDMFAGFSNCPHPLDPEPVYGPKPVTITRFQAAAAMPDDVARTATAEAMRGFENNAMMNR
jgi:uncharacterized protein